MNYFESFGASVAYKVHGSGTPLLLIHGFPTSSYTWRKLIPALSKNYKIITVDLPGLGASKYSKRTNFNIAIQAKRLHFLVKYLNLSSLSVVGHNSGGAIARLLAIKLEDSVRKMVLINTEIPNHRPPWIPFYQKIAEVPFIPGLLRTLLNFKWFIHGAWGFKELYFNKGLLTHTDYMLYYLKHLKSSTATSKGALSFLKGIDWQVIDAFSELHAQIECDCLLLWGTEDKTFPVDIAKEMTTQFKNALFIEIPNASLLPHEEQADCVQVAIQKFFGT